MPLTRTSLVEEPEKGADRIVLGISGRIHEGMALLRLLDREIEAATKSDSNAKQVKDLDEPVRKKLDDIAKDATEKVVKVISALKEEQLHTSEVPGSATAEDSGRSCEETTDGDEDEFEAYDEDARTKAWE